MFFPIRTDRRLKHTPWMNYIIIGVNVVVFFFGGRIIAPNEWQQYMLEPALPRFWQFLTYQFLHQGPMHLGGNMLFLYVFGNSVEDRLGKVGYLFFYLGGGVIAGLGHAMLESSPVLGASGAVCAVTGAYLALFPLSNVTIVYWFIFIGAFEVSSFALILLQIALDVTQFMLRAGSVAYLAHLSGYFYGFVIGMGLLLTRLLPREPYDLMSMWEHRRRRQQFRSLARQGYRPWERHKVDAPPKPGQTPHVDAREEQLMALRSRISQTASRGDLPAAAQQYQQLLSIDSGQVLSQQLQLDIANQLMSSGQHEAAARAYEMFLSSYTSYPQREQVELVLGLLYTRYLGRRQRARELLTSALDRLRDTQQQQLARQMLAEIG